MVKLKLPTGREYEPDGHIDYIDPTVAANTDTLTIRAVIPNPLRTGAKAGEPGDRELSDGEFVTVLVQGVTPVQTLAIPAAAVLSDQQGSYVYVVGADNKAVQRRITLGQAVGPLTTVSTGLKQGEVIVVDGVQRVRPNQPVSPSPAAPGPGGAGGPPGGVPNGAPAPASGSGTSPSAAAPAAGTTPNRN